MSMPTVSIPVGVSGPLVFDYGLLLAATLVLVVCITVFYIVQKARSKSKSSQGMYSASKTEHLSLANRVIQEPWFSSFAKEASQRSFSPLRFRYGYSQKDVDRFFVETSKALKNIDSDYCAIQEALQNSVRLTSKSTVDASFKNTIREQILRPRLCKGYSMSDVDWIAERVINLLYKQEVANKKLRVRLSSTAKR